MKVVVVTAYTPTPENTRGISGLLYAILRYRPKDVSVKIFSYNRNKIEDGERALISAELNADIDVVKSPKWTNLFANIWMGRFEKFFMKNHILCHVPNRKMAKILQAEHANLVWVYPYFYYKYAKLMPQQRFVLTACDCEALINVRRFETRRCLMDRKVLRHTYIMLKKGLHFESEWNLPNMKVHFVGKEDKSFYERIYGYHNSYFIRHPHYSLTDKNINFSKPKLKVILTGGCDIYTEDDINLMLPNIIKHKEELLDHFEFTLLGKNWEPMKQELEENKFECMYKAWVDDYAEELVLHDIQIAPISYGTGTKGKVLSALANGLLVIGSKYAFENIEVMNFDSCVQYNRATEIAELLLEVASNKKMYEEIAEKGRRQVRTYHNPKIISQQFFETYAKQE
ncbi:MAG: glycosyltransferase [Prevotella sp.]|nr:glycosyltransferase [Prevotella sp.]